MKHKIQNRTDGGCSTTLAAISKGDEGLATQNGWRGGWRGSFHPGNVVWVPFPHPTHPFYLFIINLWNYSLPQLQCTFLWALHTTTALSAQSGRGNDVVSSELICSVSVNQAPTVILVNYFKCKCYRDKWNVWMWYWESTLERDTSNTQKLFPLSLI